MKYKKKKKKESRACPTVHKTGREEATKAVTSSTYVEDFYVAGCLAGCLLYRTRRREVHTYIPTYIPQVGFIILFIFVQDILFPQAYTNIPY